MIWSEDGKHNRTTTQYNPANSWPLNGITELREQATGQSAQSQCFRYDDQSRLTRAFTHATAGIRANTAQTTSDYTGTSPYQSAYTYDRMGNLQSTTDTAAAGTAALRDYLYPGYDDAGTWTTADTDRPHGVRKILNKTGTTTNRTDTFTYDTDGTMLQRIEQGTTAAAKTTVDYTWTKFAQLSTAKTTSTSGSELTRYAYDADGNLLVRTTPAETVTSLGGTELRTDSSTVTATRHYTIGGATVAMRTSEGTTATNGSRSQQRRIRPRLPERLRSRRLGPGPDLHRSLLRQDRRTLQRSRKLLRRFGARVPAGR